MRYVALLRGINVGKHNRVKMAALKAALEARGFEDVETYLQSGNVLFDCEPGGVEEAEARFTAALTDLGIASHVIIRSAKEMKDVVASDPFLEIDVPDAHKNVTFLKWDCEEELPKVTPKGDAGIVLQKPREVYFYYHISNGRPADTTPLFKKAGPIPATTRNWIVTRDLARLLK